MGEGEDAVVNPFDLIEDLGRQHFAKTVLVALALGFAWFIWPTPYLEATAIRRARRREHSLIPTGRTSSTGWRSAVMASKAA